MHASQGLQPLRYHTRPRNGKFFVAHLTLQNLATSCNINNQFTREKTYRKDRFREKLVEVSEISGKLTAEDI